MFPSQRFTRPLAIMLSVALLIALLIPIATLSIQASQQLIGLVPGEQVRLSCDTQISGWTEGNQAVVTCASGPLRPPNDSSTPVITGFQGVSSGQALRGTVAIEALVQAREPIEIVFRLEGPTPVIHTERLAPYFFFSDQNGVPNGWDTTKHTDGVYTLTATARNTDGITHSQSVQFAVANGAQSTQPPGRRDSYAQRTGELQFGVAAHLFYTNRTAPLQAARGAGFGWIRQQIHWKDIEGPTPGNYAWGELDAIVESVNASGLKLMISVVRSPSFYTTNRGDGMPSDPRALGNFVAALAEHYKGRVHAIEIWNEPNLAYENGGQVSVADAGRYVELLKESYTRIKAIDPSIIVVSAPLSSTGVTQSNIAVADLPYYEAMFSYQNGVIGSYMDVLGAHPGGSANPPQTLASDNPSTAQGWTEHDTFYFRHIENVRELMVQYGLEETPVWITEFGWATPNNTPGYEFGNQVSLDQQANYIVGAMQLTEQRYPWVQAMFLWNLNFAPLKAAEGQPYHEQASFSIVNGDYSARPAYTAIQRYLAGR